MKPPRQKRRRSKSRAAAHKAIPDQLFIPLEQKLIRLALDDAAAPGEVLNASVSLIKSLRKRGVRPEALLQPAANGVTRSAPRQAPDYGSTILSFGKFRGFRIREVDPDYLRWVLGNCQLSCPAICKAIQRFLAAEGYQEGASG
jgi:hypothetical protein